MRYLVGFVIPCMVGLAVLSFGCGQDCTLIGCSDEVRVLLVPEIEVTYDVALVLDGDAEAFTCVRYNDDRREGWAPQPPLLDDTSCNGKAFTRFLGSSRTVPESVEITVSAEDGSWNGMDSTTNFERPGRTPYLYYTRHNGVYWLDRDLVRVPLTFTLEE